MAIIIANIIRMDSPAGRMNRVNVVAMAPNNTPSSMKYMAAKYRQSRVPLVPSL